MNIALFTDSYLPNADGVVSSILAYKKGLAKYKSRFVVFAPDAPGFQDSPKDAVLRFSAFKFPPYPQYRAVLFPKIPPKTAEKYGISLVHSKAMMGMGIAAYRFAKRERLPSLASVETMVPDGVHYISENRHIQAIGKAVAWEYLKWLYSKFDKVTAPSNHTRQVLLSHGIESEVLPSPVDTCAFKPDKKGGAKAKEELGLKGKKIALSVGRVVKEKNYDFILKVAKRMERSEFAFVIAGTGPYLEALKGKAAGMGLSGKVVFTGFVAPQSRLVQLYNAADVFLFPSRFETQGLTLLEAFACAKPAAVLFGTAMQEAVVEGKNGYLFGEDEKECEEAILKCAYGGEKLCTNARKTALSYSIPQCTKRLVSIYQKLLG